MKYIWYACWFGFLIDCGGIILLALYGNRFSFTTLFWLTAVALGFFVLYAYALIHLNNEILREDALHAGQQQEADPWPRRR